MPPRRVRPAAVCVAIGRDEKFFAPTNCCGTDSRNPGAVGLPLRKFAAQRLLGIVLGDEDLNADDKLHHAPLLAVEGGCPSPGRGWRDHKSLRALIRSKMAFFPSAKYMSVLSAANSGFGMPANPGERERLTTTTVRALSTSKMGMPAIGPLA